MAEIKLLPDHLINKIAAGEVVERPASVVKELVENSLDAGATELCAELVEGGRQSILVQDNGCGIARAQIPLALSRHSTSKLATEEDLHKITTLGFRGEALAAIASVARLTMTTKTAEAPAWQVKIDAGVLKEEGPAGHPQGTTIQVQDLFFHTPARLKFLKSAETEISHCQDYLIRAALAHHTVKFEFKHRGRTLLQTHSGQDLAERVRALFGKDVFEHSYNFSGGQEGVEISGRLGHPLLARGHARDIFLFVNGRPIKDRVIQHAIVEAYRDLLMRGKYPFIVLFLRVPPLMVDVNVHPAKAEVRFANSNIIHNQVLSALRKKLISEPWKKVETARPAPRDDWDRGPGFPCEIGIVTPEAEAGGDNQVYLSMKSLHTGHAEQRQIQFGQTRYAELQVLGQLLGTYLVCQHHDKLVLVDQHAAHERIGFEKLLLLHERGNIPQQRLLLPENFELNPADADIFKNYLHELAGFGLEIDHFGGSTFSVKAIPALLPKLKALNFVHDLIGDILEKGRLSSLKDQLHAVLARMSCHAAIRAHDSLNLSEMQALLRELDQYQNTSFCPHGRPVSIEVEKYEIEKWFKRIV